MSLRAMAKQSPNEEQTASSLAVTHDDVIASDSEAIPQQQETASSLAVTPNKEIASSGRAPSSQ